MKQGVGEAISDKFRVSSSVGGGIADGERFLINEAVKTGRWCHDSRRECYMAKGRSKRLTTSLNFWITPHYAEEIIDQIRKSAMKETTVSHTDWVSGKKRERKEKV